MSIDRSWRKFFLVLLIAGLPATGVAASSPAVVAAPTAAEAETPEAAAIAAILKGDGALQLAGRILDRPSLLAIYRDRDFTPIWTAARREAFAQALDGAAAQGFAAASFRVPAAPAAARDLLFSDAFLRYAAALARGRVDPHMVESDWLMPSPPFDAEKTMTRALTGSLAATLAALEPADPAYQRLQTALAAYQEDVRTARWHRLSLPLPLKPGDSGPAVSALRQRLAAEGFDAGTGEVFDDALTTAVKRYQAARGIADDGTVGPGTLAQLNVSPAARVQQIRLNLARWRMLPRRWAARRIEVNVAAETMVLRQPGEAPLTMRAVVGSPKHPTPLLHAYMTGVLLNPPWRVPSSIIENEIRPALKKNPNYLERNGYAYVDVAGGRELQQLPGPKNALGSLKFEMPNLEDIYLHDTPAHWLFRNSRRAVSHGCIRLEDPRGLATTLLSVSPDWSRSALDDAIATGITQRIPLAHALPVYVLYFTAFVDEDGTVEFRDDLYGRDHRLAAALEASDEMQPELRAAADLR